MSYRLQMEGEGRKGVGYRLLAFINNSDKLDGLRTIYVWTLKFTVELNQQK